MQPIKFWNILLLAGIISSCSSSKIISSWGTDAYSTSHKKIIVFAVVKVEDSLLQKQMEKHIVDDLSRLGYPAYAATALYAKGQLKGLNTTGVYERLLSDSVDAVMTIALLNKEKEQVYIEKSPQKGIRNNDLETYFDEVNKRTLSFGYYANITSYFWESNFYNLTAKQLVYTSRTESFTPVSLDILSHEYGKKIVNNMVKKGVLEEKRQF